MSDQPPQNLNNLSPAELLKRFEGDPNRIKIFSFFSCTPEIAEQVQMGKFSLSIHASYSEQDALREHISLSRAIWGANETWRFGHASVRVMPEDLLGKRYQANPLPPVIQKPVETVPTIPEKKEKEAADLVAYTRYVFNKAGASSRDLAIMERVIATFLQTIKK